MSFSGTVVLNCAGIGSRLGLGLTKVLMKIDGRSILTRQLELLRDVKDLRIVVGYQANAVIEEATRIRNDIIFVYNHDYFDTKTGYSLTLGSQFASEYIISWDGDLIINPKDAQKCLNYKGEFLAYTKKISDDAVYCNIDDNGDINNFSFGKNKGFPNVYEWTGLCKIKSNKLNLKDGHVYQLLEPFLPIQGIEIKAIDIDTYEDYNKAKILLKEWENDNK